ncbi:hypothetical protein FAES_3238 [Fibrella aestuarina BUZ 2]|uniref:Uncharacterized protein n=2 Tax=Fibrella TaxID=861914 RepID=I0KAU4_9BACT|nr:hypothetical protein FAES_3238 [Fibrella aestuarina BUZ 2]
MASLAQPRSAPREQGNWYSFPEQTAVNTINVRRFKKNWTVYPNHPVLVSTGVSFPKAPDAQRMITNLGVTHFEGEPAEAVGATNDQRWYFHPDQEIAHDTYGLRSQYTQGSPEYTALEAYGGAGNASTPREQRLLPRNVLPGFYNLWVALGRYSYAQHFNSNLPLGGADIETFQDTGNDSLNHAVQREFKLGWTAGWLLERDARGHRTRLVTYGIGSLAPPGGYLANLYQNDVMFRATNGDWAGNGKWVDTSANEMVRLMRRNQITYLCEDRYWRVTWGNGTVWQKNGDGSIKTDGAGKALFLRSNFPTATVTNFGTTARVYSDEAEYWAQKVYYELDAIQANVRWLSDTPAEPSAYDGNDVPGNIPYGRGPVARRPGFEKIRVGHFLRPTDTEAGTQENKATGQREDIGEPESNRRVVNAKSQEYSALLRCLFYDLDVIWDDKGYKNLTQAKAYTAVEGGVTVTKTPIHFGGVEATFNGLFRARQFPKYFELKDQNKIEFIWPKRGIRKANNVAGEYVWEKPTIALMKEVGGRGVGFVGGFLVQDIGNPAHDTPVKVWIELPDGRKTGSYLFMLKDRNTVWDWWQLPAGFENARPQDFRIQFRSLPVGTTSGYRTITWTGDYNVEWTGANPSPPPVVTPTGSNTSTTTGGGSTTNVVACSSITEAQTILTVGSEVIKAYRQDGVTLYAANTQGVFRSQSYLLANGYSGSSLSCFPETDPRISTTNVVRGSSTATCSWAMSLGEPVCTGSGTYKVPFTVQDNGTYWSVPSGKLNFDNHYAENITVGQSFTIAGTYNGCTQWRSVQLVSCSGGTSTTVVSTTTTPGDPFVSYAQAFRSQRFVGPQIFLYGSGISPIDQEIVTIAADNGANLLAPSFHWTNCEPTPGNYDWGSVDAALNLAQAKNIKLAIRLVVTRGERNNEPAKNWDKFFSTADRMRDERGYVSRWNGEVAFSYDSPDATNRAGQFITALLNHIKGSGKAGRIIAVSVVGNGYYEGEYQSGAQPADGDPVTDQLFDYSEFARQAFITRMQAKYGTIAAANAAWGQSFGSWGAVQLPIVPRGDGGDTRGAWVFGSTYTRDFYISRTQSLAGFNKAMANIIRAVSSNIQVFSENGSMYDRNCAGRGSWLLPAVTDFTDGRKQNSTPWYPLPLIQAISQQGGKWSADEVFCWKDQGTQQDYTLAQNLFHYKGALDAGASMVVLAGPQKSGSGEDAGIAQQTRDRIAAIYSNLRDTGYISGSPRFDYDDTMTITTSQLLANFGWEWWNGTSSLQADYNAKTAGGTKRVRIVMTNDSVPQP